MNVYTIKKCEDFNRYEESWCNTLKECGISHHPFTDFTWIDTYARYFLKDKELFINIYQNNGKSAILPFYYTSKRAKQISLIGKKIFDYQDIVTTSADFPEIFSFFLQSCLNSIFLPRIRDDSILWSMLCSYAHCSGRKKFLVLIRPLVKSPYLDLDGLDWGQYFTSLSRNSKSIIKRKVKKLSGAGEVNFGYCKDFAEFKQVLSIMYDQHINRRKNLGQAKSLFLDKKVRSFFDTISKKMFFEKRLLLFYLQLNSRVIATAECLSYGGILYYYVPTFEVSYREYSPGKILLYRIIEYCFKNNFKEFDFMIGDEDYKLHWNEKARQIYEVALFKKHLPGIMAYHMQKAYFFFKDIVQKLEKTWLKSLKRQIFKSLYRIRT